MIPTTLLVVQLPLSDNVGARQETSGTGESLHAAEADVRQGAHLERWGCGVQTLRVRLDVGGGAVVNREAVNSICPIRLANIAFEAC